MNSDATPEYTTTASDACNVGFVTGKAQRRLMLDGHGKGRDQQDLLDAMREDASRLVGADDAAECVFQYVLGYMVGISVPVPETFCEDDLTLEECGGFYFEGEMGA